MHIGCTTDGSSWRISLQTQAEAEAFLAAQATKVGNIAMSTTDPKIDRISPAVSAIERLHFARIVLPQVPGEDVVEFPLKESQHLSSLAYSTTQLAQSTGKPLTEFDELLAGINSQIESFFGMD